MERIQKILSAAGLCSRRQAEQYIAQGRVTVNGVVASLGAQADPDADRIMLDGTPVSCAARKVYLMLNKPRGYVTIGIKTFAQTVANRVMVLTFF